MNYNNLTLGVKFNFFMTKFPFHNGPNYHFTFAFRMRKTSNLVDWLALSPWRLRSRSRINSISFILFQSHKYKFNPAGFLKNMWKLCQRMYKTIITTGKVIHVLTVLTVGCTIKQQGVTVALETELPAWVSVEMLKVDTALCQHHEYSSNAPKYRWPWINGHRMA